MISIGFKRICTCPDNHQSCISAKEWAKAQMGVWRFNYEARDIRDKRIHPATFPIALARRVIDLFTHEGELVLDPFVGSGTTLIAAQDANKNAIGFDLQEKYVELAKSRLAANEVSLFGSATQQIAVCDDARNIPKYLEPETVRLIFTSPPYANLLNRQRKNISRRTQERKNYQFMRIEQYSQDPRDLGTMLPEQYVKELADIFRNLHPLLTQDVYCSRQHS
jgi:DNA modification methylase